MNSNVHGRVDSLQGVVSRAGDLEREFEQRLADSGTLAFRVAYAVLRRREDAEDVAQEALVRAYQRFASLRDRERFRAWLVLVFERYQKEKRVSSVPYTLSLIADGKPSRLRMGIQVPLTGNQNVPGNVIYRSVGNNIDCSAEPREDGRFDVTCAFEQASVYDGDLQSAAPAATQPFPFAPPVLRMFNSEGRFILGDGQTRQHVAGTDPVNGDVLRIGVTLSMIK